MFRLQFRPFLVRYSHKLRMVLSSRVQTLCLGPKHIVLIAKTNMNEEINSCIIDGKLYVNKVECSKATGCLNTRQ
jgi:hypothetical protein